MSEEKINVGIDAEIFKTWGGGIDFILTMTEALEATGKVNTFLLDPVDAFDNRALAAARRIKRGLTGKGWKAQPDTDDEHLTAAFGSCSPETRIVPYKRSSNRYRDNTEEKKVRCADSNNIDIILPSFRCVKKDIGIPRIGYLFDFQHKYLPELFSENEIKERDRNFKRQLDNSLYMVVNAKTVKADIERFFPDHECKISVMPFAPFDIAKISPEDKLEKYSLPDTYYMISNQFWKHKNHLVAFDALEKLYNDGHKDIHIVCTGELKDYRDPGYPQEVKRKIESLQCGKNIHLLGYIPKRDQLGIMKRAKGVIQPTLFEGGPGGGAVYAAVTLGKTCLVSDIPVNREITGYDNVFFFGADKPEQLSVLMAAHMNDPADNETDPDEVNAKNRAILGNFIYDTITEAIGSYRRRE